MKILLLLFLSCVIFQSFSVAQEINSNILEKLKNKHDLLYGRQGEFLLGCGEALECGKMQVIFYHFNLNKKKKMVRIEGRVINPAIINDSDGVFCHIFLAQVRGSSFTTLET